MTSDPFTLTIIQEHLRAASDEMFYRLGQASKSPIIYEVLDYAVEADLRDTLEVDDPYESGGKLVFDMYGQFEIGGMVDEDDMDGEWLNEQVAEFMMLMNGIESRFSKADSGFARRVTKPLRRALRDNL